MASFIIWNIFICIFWGVVLGRHCGIYLNPNSEVYVANEGEIVSVTCDMSCFGVVWPHGIRWQSPEGSTISDATGRVFIAPYHRGKKIKLFVTNVTSIDAGSYTCGGEINGDYQLVSFMLIVSDPRLGAVYPVTEDVGRRSEVNADDFTRQIRQHRSIRRALRDVHRRRHRVRKAIPSTQETTTPPFSVTKLNSTATIQHTTDSSIFPTSPISAVNRTDIQSTSDSNFPTSPVSGVSRTDIQHTSNSTFPISDVYTSPEATTFASSDDITVHMTTNASVATSDFQTVNQVVTTDHADTTEWQNVASTLDKETEVASDKPYTSALTTTARQGSQTYTQKQATVKTYTQKQATVKTDQTVATNKQDEHRGMSNAENANSFWGTNGLAAFVVMFLIAIILLIILLAGIIKFIVLPRWKKREQTLELRPKENRLSRGNTNSASYFNYKNDKPNPLLTIDNEELVVRSSTCSIQGAEAADAMTKNTSFTVISLDDDITDDPNNQEKNKTDTENTDIKTKRESNTSLSSLLENAGLNKEETNVEDNENSFSDHEREIEHDSVDKSETKIVENGGSSANYTCDDDSDVSLHSDNAKEVGGSKEIDMPKVAAEANGTDASKEIDGTRETDVTPAPES